jgi:photosystem II stability/assembly factor-like uncharacterized protein
MTHLKSARCCLVPGLLTLLLAGCAVQPRSADQTAQAESPHTYQAPDAYDQKSKRAAPREGRKRDRAGISAEFNLGMEADENGPPSAAQIFRAVAQRESLVVNPRLETNAKLAGVTSTSWQELGPGNIGGRLRAIAIDPRNPARIFVGAASGGIWLTENAGTTWRPINDFLGSLSVTTLVFDPANPNIMFAGTGEGSAGLVGVGLFRSTDSGLTWNYLSNTSPDLDQDWRFVNRISVHPQQTNIMLVGTTNGNNRSQGAIFRTTNGGQSWTKVANFKAPDVAFNPGNPEQVVAGREDGFISYSSNGGVTWQAGPALVTTLTGRSNSARAEIAWAVGQPGLVYASLDNLQGEIWRSEDAGATWVRRSGPAHMRDQGDYNNALWVDPTDPNHVITGGIDLYQSRDGGLNFTRISTWQAAPSSAHADQHAIVSVPGFNVSNPIVYFGNDGGLYRADNVFALNSGNFSPANGWRALNNGLGVTQFYAGAGKRSAGGRIIGGTQDNGSLSYQAGTNWTTWAGGDGGYSAVDPIDDNTYYGQYVYLSIHRVINGGVRQYICTGITEGLTGVTGQPYCGANATQKANFIAPFILDPNNRDRMLAGANSLWASNNVRDPVPAWAAIKPPIGGDAGTNYINAIATAEGNANIVWVGHNGGQVFRSSNALAATPTWTQVSTGLPARQVARILIHPTNHDHVIVSYTGFAVGNLWETRNAGASWTNITSNLPAAPIFSVVRHPNRDTWLYAGTSVGVFASENGGQSWSTTNDGPANVRVRELFWYSNTELIGATYGRGMYRATISRPGPDNYQGAWWAGLADNGWGLSFIQHGATLAVGWYYFNAQGQPTWAIVPGCTWDAAFTTCTGNVTASTGSWLGNYTGIQTQNSIGTATFSFTSATAGTMTWNIGGVQGTKTISKLNYLSGASPSGIDYTDIWWGGQAQNGWGVALLQQGGILAGSWYTYNQQNQPVWYLINGGAWTSPNVFTAPLTRTTGSPLIGATYNPALLSSVNAGTVTFTFTDAANATMAYTVDGVTQTKPISRLAF